MTKPLSEVLNGFGVTTAGNGEGSDPRSVEQDGKDGQAMRPMDAVPC